MSNGNTENTEKLPVPSGTYVADDGAPTAYADILTDLKKEELAHEKCRRIQICIVLGLVLLVCVAFYWRFYQFIDTILTNPEYAANIKGALLYPVILTAVIPTALLIATLVCLYRKKLPLTGKDAVSLTKGATDVLLTK